MDRLTLRIENRSDAAGDMPEDISVIGKGLSIGRKADNDWSLPDNTRFISGRHISITYDGDGYMLEDVSTNGTFVNGNSKRVDGKHKLADGDTIRIGSYIVGVLVTEVRETARPQITGAQGVQAPPMAGTMRTQTTGVQRHTTTTTSARRAQTPDFSQFQTGAKGATGVQRPGGGGVSMPPIPVAKPETAVIPDDFEDDLLAPAPSDPAKDAPAAPKPTLAAPDETPAVQVLSASDPMPEPAHEQPQPQAMEPPPPQVPEPKINAPEPQAQKADPFPPMPDHGDDPFAAPPVEVMPDPTPEPPPAPQRNADGPFSMSDPTAAPVIPPAPVQDAPPKPAVVVEKTDLTPRGLGERFAETAAPRAAPATPAPEPAAPVTPEPAPAAVNELLEGFLEGAGVDDPDTLAIPLRELGVMLGKCARLGTQEMMLMLQDRSAVKLFVAQEDRTMRIASGNNPMKFMMDPDDAFTALFVQPRDGYQTGPDGFDNALTDIRQHQQAMMAAIQPALSDMLEGLAPTDISADVGGGGGMMGSGARKSWEEYTKRWESRAAQGENGMLDAFIDAFSRRYNQALDSL